MKRPSRPRDIAARAFEIGEESTAEPAQGADELAQAFWEETGVIPPTVEIAPPLTDKWGEEERWRLWREWIERRKLGGGKKGDRRAAGRKGGLIGGKRRAAKMTDEEKKAHSRKMTKARWGKKDD